MANQRSESSMKESNWMSLMKGVFSFLTSIYEDAFVKRVCGL